MANRYWNPSGAANWADANVWALTDGGTADQATPTSSDDVYFTSTNVNNCAVAASATCKSLDTTGGTGYTGTLSGTSALTIGVGNFTLNSGIDLTYSGQLTFAATSGVSLITTAGKSILGTVIFNGSGGTFRLVDDFIMYSAFAKNLTLTAGTFDAATNSATVTISGNNTKTITGAFTFYNLTVTNLAASNTLSIASNIVISNILTITGNSAINRIFVKSDTLGTARTVTAATCASANVTNADFQDITGAGAATWDLSTSAGGSGDCGGNTGITFTTADDWYWHADTGNVSDYTKWYTATNGGGSQMASTLVPLPQDTLHFDASSFNSGSQTITQNMPRIGSIDFTGATNTPTFNQNVGSSCFGSITLFGVALLGNFFTNFSGRGNNFFTTNGITVPKAITIELVSGSLTLGSDLVSANTLTLTSGTFSAVNGENNYNVTATTFASSNTNTRTITMGSGTWDMTVVNGNPWSITSTTNLTLNAGTSTIKFSGAITGSLKFDGSAGVTYYNFWNATTGVDKIVLIDGSNTFNDFKIDAGRIQKFTNSTTTTVNTFTALGTSGSHITISNTSDTTHATLAKAGGGVISGCDYIDASYLTGSPADTWYIGANSTDAVGSSLTNIYLLDEPATPGPFPTFLQ